ncbi:MAG TPA: CHAT domain-containing protein [Sphingopyxis sp.]|nr:CHAT domain-containing protein [Sphingopyxis sp.]HMP43773.1 CHAT domain-containing protein [Sphingopyxis sp.]HMQ17526.1 CHAT domain-containing protein [Sphingopyxis sp.]
MTSIHRAARLLAALALSASAAAFVPPAAAQTAETPAPAAKARTWKTPDAELAAELDRLENAYGSASGEARFPAAKAWIEHVVRNLDRIGDSDLFALRLYMIDAVTDDDPAFAADVRRLIETRAAEARGSEEPLVELTMQLMLLHAVPTDGRLGFARAIHRRAAETGLLASAPAGSARSWIDDYSRVLINTGRVEEALRALDDSVAELKAAGVPTGVDFDLRHIEALTVGRRDAEADAAFDALLGALGRTEPNPDIARRIQLANNQVAYFRNLVGRFAAAEEPGRIAAVEAERLIGREHINTQKARYNYAVALLGQGKAAEALPYFEEALPLQREAEKDRWNFGGATDTIILLTTLARARAQVAGQEKAALDAAEEAAERLRASRRNRAAGGSDGDAGLAALARAMARGDRRDPLSRAFDMGLFAAWAARAEGPRAMDSAFVAAQDLTLTDAGNAINAAAARDIAGAGPLGELVRARQDAEEQAVRLTAAYREASLGKDGARAQAMRAELDRLGALLAEQDARLATEFPDYATLVAPKAIDVAAVQALLAPDEAVLMLLPSEGHHYAFAISHKQALWHRIDDGAAPVAALVARLKCRIDEATCSVADYNALLGAEDRGPASPIDERYPRYDRAAAHLLYRQLVAPVAAALPKRGRIYTVASGPVAGLPLAALVAKPPKGDPESGDVRDLAATDWLAKQYRFVTLPSVSALALARQAPSTAGEEGRPPLVAYGAPVLSGSGTAEARGADGQRRRGGVAVRGGGLTLAEGERTTASVDKLRQLDPLPGTVTELTRLASAIARGGGLRLGTDATESAVKADTELPRAVTVVFATHGLLPGEMGTGSEPGLVLTPPGTASLDDDGLLTASEAAALSLSAKWVVLSACNTATPGIEAGASGESLSSLARSFLYAGAGNLLASHWRVADDATAALTVEALGQRGTTPAVALARAMEAVRTGRRADGSAVEGWQPHWAHPASWAPFTLVTNRDR